jgi:hypothetical protein
VPVRDKHWLERVNEPLSAGDLKRLRHSVSRGRPYGSESWTRETATRLGLESCFRLRRRPRKDDGSKRYVPLFRPRPRSYSSFLFHCYSHPCSVVATFSALDATPAIHHQVDEPDDRGQLDPSPATRVGKHPFRVRPAVSGFLVALAAVAGHGRGLVHVRIVFSRGLERQDSRGVSSIGTGNRRKGLGAARCRRRTAAVAMATASRDALRCR